MIKQLLFVFLFALSSFSSYGQQTEAFTNDLVTFSKAVDLYRNSQYLAAQHVFSKIKEITTKETVKSDCAYYVASCAVRLNQQAADQLMESFVTDYPTSVKRNFAYINVAHYYFDIGKYSYARKWYDKVDSSSLSSIELERFNFNNGYTYFKNKRYSEARKYLNRVSDSEKYASQAKYYLGFIAYDADEYETANALFEEVKGEERYAEGLSYYKADMNFKLGKFEKAIALGKEKYDDSSPAEKSQLSKIIGESSFNLERYQEAIPFLENYKGIQGKWNNTDYYQLGYAYYKEGNYERASSEFNKIVGGKNSVAQNAYYHLAESYVKQDQKQQALNAFKNASEMSFSAEIQEDAWLNYAKLSYEIGNSYVSVPQVLLSFITSYPDNKNNEELRDLLIDSYMTSKNYREAMELLENNKSFENKLAYQKVAFYRGVEVYNEGNYLGAITLFETSLKEPRDANFTARATYWKAECDFQLSNFESSLIGYKQYLQLPTASESPEFRNSAYNLAYNYFKLKNYSEAIASFNTYVSNPDAETARKKDAHLRLGDSYFVTSEYWPAMENYNAAIEMSALNNDYAQFQKAISYGFVDRIDTKVEALNAFIKDYPKSVYRDDALYELGNTYVSQDRTNEAISMYDKLALELPQSSFISKSLLKKALILDNTGKSNDALLIFKQVARDYPSSPEALQAVSSAKIIYIDQGDVNAYATWVQTLDFVGIEDAELDDATFQVAERAYRESKVSQAISRLEDYLEQFPAGNHALSAHFYLGQMYFADGNSDAAIPQYLFTVSKERNAFTEQALSRISELYLVKKDYQNALPYLERLAIEGDFPQNIIFALTNSMKASYELKQYTEAVAYAEKVLANSRIDNTIKSDAQVIIARSAMQTGNEEKAKAAYIEVSKISSGKLAAEALYYEAYFKNKEGEFAASNDTIQVLAKDFSGYKFYGAKSLVLMAQNFYALGDAFQASYILESVIANFKDYPDVLEEAKVDLAAIKATEAKTNSSIETDEN